MARKKHLINVHTSTGTTAPTGASLYLGEIAVQHTPNDPALWIKMGTAQTSTDYEKFIGETEILNLISGNSVFVRGEGQNSAQQVGSGAEATGDNSVAEGDGVASGDYSHAEGLGTESFGDLSHAEGSETLADGEASHSEGAST